MFVFDTLVSSLVTFAVIIHGFNLVKAKNPSAEDCPQIVSRSAWDAEEPTSSRDFPSLPEFVVICHTVTPECRNQTTCSARIRSMQNYHMEVKHFEDIAYNFMIGEDGAVYEGRGWDKVGSHTARYNSRSLGIAFIGNFREHTPDPVALNIAHKLIACGVLKGKIPQEYKLVGHRQVSDTISPGEKLFDEIKTWPRWTSNLSKE